MTHQLYAIIAHDRSASDDAKARLREAHLEHFRNIAESIAVAGPMFDDSGNGSGSLIIVRADSPSVARDLIKGDPFFTEGVWERLEVKAFKAASGTWA